MQSALLITNPTEWRAGNHSLGGISLNDQSDNLTLHMAFSFIEQSSSAGVWNI